MGYKRTHDEDPSFKELSWLGLRDKNLMVPFPEMLTIGGSALYGGFLVASNKLSNKGYVPKTLGSSELKEQS